jgi:ubiquinone biosynthesis protein COQ9
LLAGVYSSTLLFWLDDKSDGFADSWAFLDRRIANVMQIPGRIAKLRETAERAAKPFAKFWPQRRSVG